MNGTLFFVVGPSGIGKDTLLSGARAALADDPDFVFARRTITRPADVGDEGHLSVSAEEFARIHDSGGFLVSWSAHGLRYGIPAALDDELAQGRNVVINGSRAAVPDLLARRPDVVVVEITAPAEVIAQRMRARGRDDDAQMTARLSRVTPPLPAGARAVTISNDADIATGVARLVAALKSQPAPAKPARTAGVDGARAVRAKLAGEELSEAQYRVLLGEFVQRKHSDEDLKQFLIAATRSLSIAEIASIARVRAEFAPAIAWDEPMVVDKHSMGGVPGSRITMVVIPIVAAHGLAIPKTSSRAITSAAGTADAMETVSRVDLDRDAVRRVVSIARGCIAWNGRLNHSALDDVMNAITRPLGLDSARWSVASILSKKLAAGITHLIVDLPYGPYAKVKDERGAQDLAELFRSVGNELGLTVEVYPSEGFAPIGRGIGPALEVRDVLDVLEQRPSAPADLRDKALKFAGRILQWAPDIASGAAANARAAQLLASGAAKAAFERIVDTQGRRTPRVMAGPLTATVAAPRSGTVAGINGWRISGIARRAGAPGDAGAGLDLFARCGDTVRAGEALYAIHANEAAGLAAAAGDAAADSGFDIR